MPLSKFLLVIISLNFLFTQSAYDKWFSKHLDILEAPNKKIEFNLKMVYHHHNQTQNEQVSILLGENSKLNINYGTRQIIFDSEELRSYDSRNNQIFIHDPNEIKQFNLHTLIEKLKNPENISVHDDLFTLFIEHLGEVNFALNENAQLREVWLHRHEMSFFIDQISIVKLSESEIEGQFKLDVKSPFIFDLRDE